MADPPGVSTLDELAGLLRDLRRRQARRVRSSPLSFHELAARTGWPHGVIGEYFAGAALPPAERLDTLVRLLGATPDERGALAAARARIERLGPPHAGTPAAGIARPALPALAAFAGRAGAVARLDRLLADGRTVLVSGAPGTGKTALAVHYGLRIAGRFPDGLLFLDLRGSDPAEASLSSAEALRILLAALGVAPADVPLGLPARTGMYRTLTARRGVLLVLDDAADAEQVRPLLPGAGDSAALVTSRDRLAALFDDGAAASGGGTATVALPALDRTEARAMLAGRIGAERCAAEPAAVDRIITACGRLPMALAVVSARAAQHPSLRLAQVAEALDAHTPFSWSQGMLSPAARRLFRLAGAHPGPDFAAPAAAVLCGLSPVDVLVPLAELSRAQLVVEHPAGRFAMHQLLREHAIGLGSPAEPAAALDRLVEHYAGAAAREDPAPPDSWFAAEHRVLLGVVDLAMRRGRYTDACRLAQAMSGFLDRAGHWDDWIAVQGTAIRAAEHLGDPLRRARAQRGQSAAYLRTGRYEPARERLRQAFESFHERGEDAEAARCQHDLGRMLEAQARFAEAVVHDELALALFRRAEDPDGQCRAHAAAAMHYARIGRAAEAVAHGEEALLVRRRHGDARGVAVALARLGDVHRALGDRQRAQERYREALDRFTEQGDRLDEADTATRLGDVLEGAQAIGLWRRALALYNLLSHPAAATLESRLGL